MKTRGDSDNLIPLVERSRPIEVQSPLNRLNRRIKQYNHNKKSDELESIKNKALEIANRPHCKEDTKASLMKWHQSINQNRSNDVQELPTHSSMKNCDINLRSSTPAISSSILYSSTGVKKSASSRETSLLSKSNSTTSKLKFSSNLFANVKKSQQIANSEILLEVKKLSKKIDDDELQGHLHELELNHNDFKQSQPGQYAQYEHYKKLIGKIEEFLIHIRTVDYNNEKIPKIHQCLIELKQTIEAQGIRDLSLIEKMHRNRKNLHPAIIDYFEQIPIAKIVHKMNGNPFILEDKNNIQITKLKESNNSLIYMLTYNGNKEPSELKVKATLRITSFFQEDLNEYNKLNEVITDAKIKMGNKVITDTKITMGNEVFTSEYAAKSTIENGGMVLAEYLEGGNLKQRIQNDKLQQSTQQILYDVYQILNIMDKYLDNDFVYCDGKLENFVANDQGQFETPDEKSIRRLPTSGYFAKEDLIGITTLAYLPPELTIAGQVNVQNYVSYVCGLICYQIATKDIIEEDEIIKFDFTHSIFKEEGGDALKNIISSLTNDDPNKRLNIKQAKLELVEHTPVETSENESIDLDPQSHQTLQLVFNPVYEEENNTPKMRR